MGKNAEITTVAVGIIRTILQHKEGYNYLIGQIMPHRKHPGKWEFPGGKLEGDENVFTALARELREELGIEMVHGMYRVIHQCQYAVGHEPPYNLVFILVTEFTGEPQAHEHTDLRWETLEELSARDDLIDEFMLDALRNV